MSSEAPEASDRTLTMIGVGSAVMNLVAFTAVGALTLDSVAYGGIAGLLGCVGSFLFVPWFLGLSAAQENAADDAPFSAAVERAPGSAQRGVLGLGLELGAIVMLAVGFAFDAPEFVAGGASGLVVALAVYLVGSIALSR